MRSADSRQSSLLEAPAPLRGTRARRGLVTRPPRGAVEIVRHPDGPLEVKVSGLVDSAERRLRQWQGVAALLFILMVVGAALAVVVVALRWDYERARAVKVLQADLETARARERCWEALVRYTPRGPDDVITPARRDGWIARCLTTELSRVNAGR
ncbi:MAG TPA: hypothetical protein VFE48_05560 [Methylomirabilota bacterium]|nr:hypothetical protein [Methylomirabilota bacterium]